MWDKILIEGVLHRRSHSIPFKLKYRYTEIQTLDLWALIMYPICEGIFFKAKQDENVFTPNSLLHFRVTLLYILAISNLDWKISNHKHFAWLKIAESWTLLNPNCQNLCATCIRWGLKSLQYSVSRLFRVERYKCLNGIRLMRENCHSFCRVVCMGGETG